jgi:hypothetical protein
VVMLVLPQEKLRTPFSYRHCPYVFTVFWLILSTYSSETDLQFISCHLESPSLLTVYISFFNPSNGSIRTRHARFELRKSHQRSAQVIEPISTNWWAPYHQLRNIQVVIPLYFSLLCLSCSIHPCHIFCVEGISVIF